MNNVFVRRDTCLRAAGKHFWYSVSKELYINFNTPNKNAWTVTHGVSLSVTTACYTHSIKYYYVSTNYIQIQ